MLTAASRGLSEIICHRRDSYLSDEAVGGLMFDFERISGGVIDTYHTQAQRNALADHVQRVPARPRIRLGWVLSGRFPLPCFRVVVYTIQKSAG